MKGKIDFIIAGVMKCGTTTLGEYLKLHEEIAIPEWEVGFFSKPHLYNKGYQYYEDYVGKHVTEKTKVRGEKTPYSFDRRITPMIHEYNPNIKLIFVLRNPTLRAWSNYGHDLWNVYEWKSFEKCIEQENEREPLYQYLSKGRYVEQIDDYMSFFKREQILLLTFEELISNKKAVLKKVFEFLEVDPDNYDYAVTTHNKKSFHPRFNTRFLVWYKKNVGKNFLWGRLRWFHFKGNIKKTIPESMKERLDRYYKPYNEELSRKYGVDISKWNNESK